MMWMFIGASERDWEPVSHMMSLLANCHRSKKQRPFKASDFNPMAFKRRFSNALPHSEMNMKGMETAFNTMFGRQKVHLEKTE